MKLYKWLNHTHIETEKTYLILPYRKKKKKKDKMSKVELGMNGRDTQLSREKQSKVEDALGLWLTYFDE
jgi:hypothetical protein